MPLRQIEILAPRDKLEEILEKITKNGEDHERDVRWVSLLEDDSVSVKTIRDVESLEAITDTIENTWDLKENVRILVYPVEATIPRLIAPEEEAAEKEAKAGNGEGGEEVAEDLKEEVEEGLTAPQRIHREELYSDLYDVAKPSRNTLILAVLSAVVAAIGLLRGSEAVVIGGMVIAPMLGPNVALALATTLGDSLLARKAALSGLSGVVAAFLVAVLMGLFLPVDPSSHVFASRSSVELGDLALALAAGMAGTLSYTMGMATAVVGVMVAVALVPPLVACGLLLGAGKFGLALGAGGLFAVNVVGINLAGVLTFLYQGLRPTTWWEKENAKRATRHAVTAWLVLLVLLAGLIVAFGRFGAKAPV
ncbi:Conserved hypothetical protein CHP00341 [Desulfovibrio sp. X2]|uniref:TIGR00341 family protein n=1 Tax=Desulfovibrio sp. X2 TaxID=941449 RepID=UPI000358EE6F|nr:TIGR00341 family protein [Desulfovibrio sp. X2]EPR44744.1 Conserved hypothetical protein CHP00341 [Desulfovibrio sp. X2]